MRSLKKSRNAYSNRLPLMAKVHNRICDLIWFDLWSQIIWILHDQKIKKTWKQIISSDKIVDDQFFLQLQQAECRTPGKIQDVLDKGCSAVKEIKSLQQQHKQLSAKVDSHVQKLQPLADRLSCLVSQIAEVERFRAYVSWIQKIESVRYNSIVWF